ncbi:MAG TPA: LssY C-terminal domain-containing protein, partial [Chthoniobacteraceae bacterium]|nr:LssY C-terminal domain-containing protein [Chthoniobacteraceae bacterium]
MGILFFLIKAGVALIAIYYVLAYWIAPALWTHYEHHPKLAEAPKTTLTKEGIPGDPLNVGLVGNHEDVIHSLVAAGWLPADPITFKTSLRITESALLGKPYPTAPVSNLYVFGRVEDLAFEQAVEGNTRERNHVRFWSADELGKDGKPFWIGAATFD